MKSERCTMQKIRLSALVSLLAAGMLMGGCAADFGGESESEGGAAQGPNAVGSEAVGEAKQALPCGALYGGQTLSAGQSMTSCDGRFTLRALETEGNVVLTGPAWQSLCATGTSGAGNKLAMKPDGDLVVSSSSNEVVWSSGTAGNSGA